MDTYLYLLLRATFVLSLSGSLVWVLMSWKPIQHPWWHRMAWGLVLVQGIVLVPWAIPFSIPTFGLIPDSVYSLANSGKDSADELLDEANEVVGTEENSSQDEVLTSAHDPSDESELPVWEAATPLLASDAVPVTKDHALETNQAATTQSVPSDSENSQATNTWYGRVASTLPQVASLEIPWLKVLTYLWLSGLIVVLIRLYVSYRLLAAELRKTTAARPKWSRELQQLLVELNIRQNIQLRVHREIGPFLCWTPRGYRIVVPVGLWNQLSETERLAVLHHELCHLRRGDLWKAFWARLVVACHWFNPLAWLAASRFDESAEWACDQQLAKESPTRITELAKALLVATESQQTSPAYLSLAVTGGPTFQRIHRLVAPAITQDSWLKRTLWLSIFNLVILSGGIQWQLQSTSAVSAMSPQQESSSEPSTAEEPATTDDWNELQDYIPQIQTGENETLKRFVELLNTPTGQLLMKDRAAIAAQEDNIDLNPDQIWQQFQERNFEQHDGKWTVRGERNDAWKKYLKQVQTSIADVEAIAAVFKSTAANLEGITEPVEVLKQLLNHEAAAAFVYQTELKTRLHPGISEIEERFQDLMVRDQAGQYVIRPARRTQVQKRLQALESLAPPLARFEQELNAWADDIAKTDDNHKKVADILRTPPFAKFLMLQRLREDLTLEDPHMDGFFDVLEDATNDTAKGLVLNLDSESYENLKNEMERFEKIWNYRDALAEPLHEIALKVQSQDELHEQLRVSLESDLGLLSIAINMEYLPVTAAEAAEEWLTAIVSKNENGKFEWIVSSEEDFKSRVEDFYRQYRDMRRRGRVIDEFSDQLADRDLATAMRTFPGKHQLTMVILESVPRPEVDGLKRWFEAYFTQTESGWQLNDGAAEVIDQFINEAAELEKELAKDDF